MHGQQNIKTLLDVSSLRSRYPGSLNLVHSLRLSLLSLCVHDYSGITQCFQKLSNQVEPFLTESDFRYSMTRIKNVHYNYKMRTKL